MSAPRLLVFGRTGQVAQALAAHTGAVCIFLGREDADLSRPETLGALIKNSDCDAVVNAAAYTAVDKAESEPDLARRVNAEAPGEMARVCARVGTPFVHLSTDYVFDGSGNTPKSEDEPIAPLNIYGRTKAEGEARVLEAGGVPFVLRTSWVYAPWGANFVRTMVRLGAEREEMKVVADQIGAPTSALDIAGGIVMLATAVKDGARFPGVYHMTAQGEASWYDLAVAIFAQAARRGRKVPGRVLPIASAEYPTPARRPLNSRLDGTKLEKTYGIRLPQWTESLSHVMDTILNEHMQERPKA
jgi:dTDP-4-dehydrorhamnose reductase